MGVKQHSEHLRRVKSLREVQVCKRPCCWMGDASGAQVKYGQIKSALKTTVIGLSQGRVQSALVVPDNLDFQVNNN